jgi:2'-5' RNA ligase
VKYTLWFQPGGEVRDRLSGIIRQFGARFGAPEFVPHVTLLPGCVGPRHELIGKAERVASVLRPFTIKLEDIDFREEYYRCLFVHAALTRWLRGAHQAACQEFGRQHEPVFMPHVSLLYGTFPLRMKKEAREAIGPRLDIQFKAHSLYLYRTHGGPLRWRRMARFALG